MKLLFFIKLFLVTSLFPVHLVANTTFVQICFDSEQMTASALKEAQFLKTDEDLIKKMGSCLNINTAEHKKDLFIKFMRQKYSATVYDSSEEISKTECKITVRKVSRNQNNTNSAGINPSGVGANTTKVNEKLTSISKLILMEGLPGTIEVNKNKLDIVCKKKGKGYEIQIKSQSKDMAINTSRFVQAGQEIELGSIVSSKDKDNQEISITNGVVVKKSKNNSQDLVYLKVE